MGRVRLREGAPSEGNGTAPAPGVALKPLCISGVVVTKTALVQALKIYVPALNDIQVTEDGENFWLILDEGGQDEDSTEG